MTAAGLAASSLGLSELVARGYGTVCWGFLLLFALPMLTRGRRMLALHERRLLPPNRTGKPGF